MFVPYFSDSVKSIVTSYVGGVVAVHLQLACEVYLIFSASCEPRSL